jgi:hypothetical protein
MIIGVPIFVVGVPVGKKAFDKRALRTGMKLYTRLRPLLGSIANPAKRNALPTAKPDPQPLKPRNHRPRKRKTGVTRRCTVLLPFFSCFFPFE